MKAFILKIFFLFIFLFANLYFAIKVDSLKTAKNEFSNEEIVEAVEVLSGSGVLIRPDAVIKEKSIPKVLKFDFDASSLERIAKKIMNSNYGTFTVPDGQRFASDTETLSVFYDYAFEYRNLSYEGNFDDAEVILNNTWAFDQKDAEKYEKLFEELAWGEGITIKTKNVVYVEPYVYYSATECIGGKEIETSGVVAVFDEEELIFATGKIFFSDAIATYDSKALDSINILFNIDKSPIEIEKMEIVYYPVADKNNSFYLTPNYKFFYYDGTTYIYDATSGVKK